MKLLSARAIISICLSAIGIGSVAAEQVRIGIPNNLNVSYAPFAFGDSLGFFKEEGLEIEIVSLQGSGVLVPQVATKRVTVGLANPDLMIVALAKGEPYPISYTYNWLRKSIYELTVKPDSGIKTVADLKGKKLGIGALSWGNIPMIKAILRDSGLEWGKDVSVFPLGVGPAAWKQFSDGKVDVMAYYSVETELMSNAGIPARRLPIPPKYEMMFSSGLVFHNDTIASNPKLVEGMGRAVAKSMIACSAALTACTRSYWKLDPTSRPPQAQEAKWVEENQRVVKAYIDSAEYFGQGQERQAGRFFAENWSQHVEVMRAAGTIADSQPATEKIYTNRFVSATNGFDHASIKARALAFQEAR